MKHLVKLAIGAVVYYWWRLFFPNRLAAVQEQSFASHHLSFLERQVLAFSLLRTGMDTRTASSYWAGAAGSRFHAHGDHRLTLDSVATDNFYRRPMLDEFASQAATWLRRGASVIEVGCGAGGNLLYLRSRLPGLGFTFVGYDINNEVVASNAEYNGTDLRFEMKNCFDTDISAPADVGLIFCAVLMYAQEKDIVRLLRSVVRGCRGRVLLGLSEPVLDPEATQPLPHNNLALLHGYRRILRQLGFRQQFESLRQEEGKDTFIYHAVFELVR
jgi:SAM-dependent methyltransferase